MGSRQTTNNIQYTQGLLHTEIGVGLFQAEMDGLASKLFLSKVKSSDDALLET
jgi:hypothetical protein